MSLIKARQLREQRMKIVKDATAILDGETITAEQRTKFDAMMADAELLKSDIDRLERVEAIGDEHRSAPPADRPNSKGWGELTPEERGKKAFRSYLIHGLGRMEPEERDFMMGLERRDMGTGGGNALQGVGGGYFVPVGFVDEVESAMKWYGSMLKVATVIPTTSGQPLPFPTANDTTVTGELIAEAGQVSMGDVTLSAITFGAYMYSTKMVKVSRQLLQDSAFDMQTFLRDKFAERLGRIVNTHTTTGTGANQPNGIVTASTASGVTAAGSAGNSGGAETGQTTVGSDDLLDLEHSIDIAYRQGAMYMMHDTTLKVIKKVKDKYGRPLWMPGLATKEPDTINGYEYMANNDMAPIATGVKSILFGQLKKYIIREVKELSVLRLEERYAEYGQVAFIGFARYDGNLIDAGTHPVKYLVQA